ncbi:g116 [Coccomyxa elongata]
MIESSAPPGLEGDTLMSATPKATEEGAAPFDASQDLLVGNAEEKESDGQSSTDGCVRQNKGMNAGEAATIINDDSATVFGDLEEVKEGTLQSKGDTDAPDDAESEDGFGGFEEADTRSPTESIRGDDGVEVKAEALSSVKSSTPEQVPAVSAAGSNADIFITSRAEFLAQVRKLLSPSAIKASELEGNGKWPCIPLDLLINQLTNPQSSTKSDTSHVAVHASVIGAQQAQYQEVTPIKWEGSKAERRFLSRFARSKVESSARQQPSTGHQHAQTDNAGRVDIFAASGAVVNGEYLAGSSGARKTPVENGDHTGIVGAGPTQASKSAEVLDQPALDTSGFGAWATDPTLIPGVLTSSNTGAGRELNHSTPAASSAAQAHLESRASPRRVSDRHAGTSPSRLRSRQQSNNNYQPKKQDETGEPERLNFEALIPGYERMSVGEKLKARTKLLLARTSKNDTGNRERWTRFMFNKDALLDEEGADDFGGGANAVSLKVPAAQARQEERMQSAQEAHEAAIFGRPAAVPHEQDHSSLAAVGQRAGLGARLPSAEPEYAAQLTAAMPIQSEAVQTQKAASWRERAAQLRAQRQAA